METLHSLTKLGGFWIAQRVGSGWEIAFPDGFVRPSAVAAASPKGFYCSPSLGNVPSTKCLDLRWWCRVCKSRLWFRCRKKSSRSRSNPPLQKVVSDLVSPLISIWFIWARKQPEGSSLIRKSRGCLVRTVKTRVANVRICKCHDGVTFILILFVNYRNVQRLEQDVVRTTQEALLLVCLVLWPCQELWEAKSSGREEHG
jgi:hypothetical protein